VSLKNFKFSKKKILFFILLSYLSLFIFCKKVEIKIIPIRSNSFQNKIAYNFSGVKRKKKKKIENNNNTRIDWSKETIYFIVIDRFNDADKSNDYYVNRSNPFAWHGGDLQGIINKLDYIKNLGFTAIWITPPVDNDELPTSKKYHFYHGYHAKDFYNIDEHFGTIKLYKQLVKQAHTKGIKVIQDIVFNQAGFTHPFVKNKKYKNWFHHNKPINNEKKEEYEQLFGSPDFNQNNKSCKNFLIDYAKYWLEIAPIDGFRLDAMKHVTYSFWPTFTKQIKQYAGKNFFLMGEVLERNPNELKKYFRSKVDSLVDFPLHYIIQDVFKHDADINLLSKYLASVHYNSKNKKNILATFIDNHDTERFSTNLKNKYTSKKMRLALTFIYSIRGLPIVYYGSEILMQSQKNQDAATGRKLMKWNLIKKNNSLIKHIRKLNLLRKKYSALSQGSTIELYKDYSKIIFLKQDKRNEAIIILNNSFYEESADVLLPNNSIFLKKSSLKDFFTNKIFIIKNKHIKIKIPAKTAYIFVIRNNNDSLKNKVASNNKIDLSERYISIQKSKYLPKDIKNISFLLPFNKIHKSVFIAGDFNGWNSTSFPLKLSFLQKTLKKKKNKQWQITIPLRKGTYSYKFIVNNKWIIDPNEQKNSGKPYHNSIKIVK